VVAPDGGPIRGSIARMLSPVLLGSALMLFARAGNVFFLILGSLLSEIILWNSRAKVLSDN
jgi:hypothetical protein